MIRFDFGANSANFRLNKSAVIPTPMTSTVGYKSIGFHNFIGMGPSVSVNTAWVEWLTTVMTSLKAVANKEIKFDISDLSGYLQFCGCMDIMLAEAKRDLTMINFGDILSTSGVRDYFGPSYQAAIDDAIENGPKYWSRWNSLARHMAETFPHMNMPFYDQFAYLVGNVFKDSNSGRWRYLYLHMWNKTFNKEFLTGDPSAYGGLTAAETAMAAFENALRTNSGEGPLTAAKAEEIKGLLLNAYGSKCARDYGLVIDYHTLPSIVYDPDLITQLNNAVLPPSAVWGANQFEMRTMSLADPTMLINLAGLTSGDLYETAQIELISTPISTGQGTTAYIAYNTIQGLPLTLYGPNFDGAAGLWNVGLIESWTPETTPSGDDVVLTVKATSPFGVVLGKWFATVVSPTSAAAWSFYHTGSLRVGNASTVGNTLVAGLMNSIAALNQFDFGNFLIWDAATGSYTTAAEPVDEFAIISRPSLQTYTEAGVMGLFDSYLTKFRTTRTADYRVEGNTASVSSPATAREARGHSRFPRKSKRSSGKRGDDNVTAKKK